MVLIFKENLIAKKISDLLFVPSPVTLVLAHLNIERFIYPSHHHLMELHLQNYQSGHSVRVKMTTVLISGSVG